MKKCFYILILLAIGFINVKGQSAKSVNPDKYRINLPGFWKPGNKVWQILSDKLPVVCDELKDKELCGDNCNPKYTIEFLMTEPEILDYYSNHISSGRSSETWQFVTTYRFSSSLLLFNEKDELIVRFILVDSDEVWRVSQNAELKSFVPTRPRTISIQSDPAAQALALQYIKDFPVIPAQQGQSPFSYINNNKDKLSPTQRDMLNVVDEKIRSW